MPDNAFGLSQSRDDLQVFQIATHDHQPATTPEDYAESMAKAIVRAQDSGASLIITMDQNMPEEYKTALDELMEEYNAS